MTWHPEMVVLMSAGWPIGMHPTCVLSTFYQTFFPPSIYFSHHLYKVVNLRKKDKTFYRGNSDKSWNYFWKIPVSVRARHILRAIWRLASRTIFLWHAMPFFFLLPRGCPYRFLRPPIHASVRYVSKQQSGHGWDFCKLEAVFLIQKTWL